MESFKIKVTKLTDEEFARRLGELEERYQMSSEEFLRRYSSGELGDDLEFIHWAGLLHMRSLAETRARARS